MKYVKWKSFSLSYWLIRFVIVKIRTALFTLHWLRISFVLLYLTIGIKCIRYKLFSLLDWWITFIITGMKNSIILTAITRDRGYLWKTMNSTENNFASLSIKSCTFELRGLIHGRLEMVNGNFQFETLPSLVYSVGESRAQFSRLNENAYCKCND